MKMISIHKSVKEMRKIEISKLSERMCLRSNFGFPVFTKHVQDLKSKIRYAKKRKQDKFNLQLLIIPHPIDK